MKYRLGIDMGSTSLGWAMVSLDDNDQPVDLIDLGVRIFPDGREAKTHRPLSVIRREKRGARRRRDRYLERRNKLIEKLIEKGLMPQEKKARKQLEHLDPYACRAKAVLQKLPLYHIGRALFHINQRRGFKSNRIADVDADTEVQGMKAAIERMARELDGRTVGQYLYEKHQRRDTVRLRPQRNGNSNDWDFYISREMIDDEVTRILDFQKQFYPDVLTPEYCQQLRSIIVDQRPLKIPEPGWCTLLEGEKRARLAYPEVQHFRILQEVNNLHLKRFSPSNPDITDEQRNILVEELTHNFQHVNKQGMLTWAKIRKMLGLSRAAKFNLDELGRKGLSCDTTSHRLSNPEYFGSRWWTLTDDEKNELVDKLATEPNKDVLEQWLATRFKLDAETAKKLANTRLAQGYGSVSLAAIRRLLPHLRAGMTYDKACAAEGIEHSDLHTGEIFINGDLPYYGQLLRRYVIGGDQSFDPHKEPEKHYGKITNPTVHIALNQLRVVINALVRKYGPPSEIHIELARELPLGERGLSQLKSDIARGRKENERIDEELRKIGVVPNYANRMKFKLWEDLAEQPHERCCPFTGKVISLSALFSDEFEVEHLLPFSLSFDDSRANKVISHRDANRFKSNRSPYEAFGDSPPGYDWNAIIARVDNFANPHKKWRFQPDAWEIWKKNNGDVIARMLNDTRYMTRVAREYLSYACPKHKVVSVTGQLTALLRHHWGLNRLLSVEDVKERGDHRHHAIDALVVACTSRSALQKVSTAARMAQSTDRLLERLEKPYPKFAFEKLKERIDTLVVSYKPDHGKPKPGMTVGQLHEETYYGRLGDSDKKGYGIYVTRRPFTQIEPEAKKINEIANIQIREDLLAAHERLKGNKKEWQRFLQDYAQANNVRRVRVHIQKSDDVMIPIKDKAGKPYRYVQGGSNYCADIWCTDKGPKAGKWQCEVISMFDAHQPDFRPRWRTEHPTAWRVMRLQINDTVALEENGQRILMRVKKINSDGRVYLRQLNIAIEKGDSLSKGAPASTLQRLNARKIFVSPIGEVKDPGHARKSDKCYGKAS